MEIEVKKNTDAKENAQDDTVRLPPLDPTIAQ